MPPSILAFAGSTRRESFNKKLVAVAAQGARQAGAKVTLIDLADYPLPMFDQDDEAANGMPETAAKLKALFVQSDGLLISAPEYNSSLPAVLKNTIDWVSRSTGDEGPLALTAFRGKTAALLSASPGGLGGMRGLVHVRSILGNIGVTVLPDQLAVSQAHEAFDDDGALKDPRKQEQARGIGRGLAEVTAKLATDPQ